MKIISIRIRSCLKKRIHDKAKCIKEYHKKIGLFHGDTQFFYEKCYASTRYIMKRMIKMMTAKINNKWISPPAILKIKPISHKTINIPNMVHNISLQLLYRKRLRKSAVFDYLEFYSLFIH